MLVKIITMYNEEELIDHILLHYLKERVPIWLMFSLFDAPGVLFMVICEIMLRVAWVHKEKCTRRSRVLFLYACFILFRKREIKDHLRISSLSILKNIIP